MKTIKIIHGAIMLVTVISVLEAVASDSVEASTVTAQGNDTQPTTASPSVTSTIETTVTSVSDSTTMSTTASTPTTKLPTTADSTTASSPTSTVTATASATTPEISTTPSTSSVEGTSTTESTTTISPDTNTSSTYNSTISSTNGPSIAPPTTEVSTTLHTSTTPPPLLGMTAASPTNPDYGVTATTTPTTKPTLNKPASTPSAPGVGHNCSSINDCPEPTLVCDFGKSQNEGLCKRKVGIKCATISDCISNSTCKRGKCICKRGYAPDVNSTTCSLGTDPPCRSPFLDCAEKTNNAAKFSNCSYILLFCAIIFSINSYF